MTLKEVDLPDIQPGYAIVEAERTGISPGTELRMLNSPSPERGGQAYVPGYCVVGRVVSTGERDDVAVGDRVLCPGGETGGGLTRVWGGHQSVHLVPEAAVIPVDPSLTPDEVVLNKLASIAYRGVRAGRATAGQRVLVIGLGIIGQAAARLWRHAGCDVTGVDRIESRLQLAARGGVTVADDLAAAGDGFDALIDCTGAAGMTRHAMLLLRQDPWTQGDAPGPVYVLQGSFLGDVQYDYQAAFQRQATVVIPRDSTLTDQQDTLDLVASGHLQLRELLTDIVTPDQADDAYRRLSDDTARCDTLGIAFSW